MSSKVSLDAFWEDYMSRCVYKKMCTHRIYMEGSLYNQRVYFGYCDNTNFSPSDSKRLVVGSGGGGDDDGGVSR